MTLEILLHDFKWVAWYKPSATIQDCGRPDGEMFVFPTTNCSKPRSLFNFRATTPLLNLVFAFCFLFVSVLSFAQPGEEEFYHGELENAFDDIPVIEGITADERIHPLTDLILENNEFNVEKAQKGLYFLENKHRIVNRALKAAQRLIHHLEAKRAELGQIDYYTKFIANDPALQIVEKDQDGKEMVRAHSTVIDLTDDQKEPIIRVVDYETGFSFVFLDPAKLSLDHPKVIRYLARQKTEAGHSSKNQRGRDTIVIATSSDRIRSLDPAVAEPESSDNDAAVSNIPSVHSYVRNKIYQKGWWRDRWDANVEPINAPEFIGDSAFSLGVSFGVTGLTQLFMQQMVPGYQPDPMIYQLTLIYNLLTTIPSGTYRNLLNGGHGRLERMLRRSVVSLMFAFHYSIARKAGTINPFADSFTFDHIAVLDWDGVVNAGAVLFEMLSQRSLEAAPQLVNAVQGMLKPGALVVGGIFANTALSRLSSEPTSDFLAMRREMRLNTRKIVFIPKGEDPQNYAKSRIQNIYYKVPYFGTEVKLETMVSSEEIIIPVSFMSKAWRSRWKQQNFEGPLVQIPTGIMRLVDQFAMTVATSAVGAAAVSTAHHAATSGGGMYYIWGKVPLLLFTVSTQYAVLKWALKQNYEHVKMFKSRWKNTRNLMINILPSFLSAVFTGTPPANGDVIMDHCGSALESKLDKYIVTPVGGILSWMNRFRLDSSSSGANR